MILNSECNARACVCERERGIFVHYMYVVKITFPNCSPVSDYSCYEVFILYTSPQKLSCDPGQLAAAPTGAAGVLDEGLEKQIVNGNIDTATTSLPILGETNPRASFRLCPHSNITPVTSIYFVVPYRSDYFFSSIFLFGSFGVKRKQSPMFLELSHFSLIAF